MPLNYSAYRSVSPVHTGFMATTAPVQTFIGRLATPRITVNNPDYIGQIWVDSHVGFMGGPGNTVIPSMGPIPAIQTGDPTSTTYTAIAYGVKSVGISKKGAARSQFPEDLVQREFRALRAFLEAAEEVRYAALYQTTANFTTTSTCANLITGIQWGSIGAQPVADLRDYINTVRKAAHGNPINAMILPYDVAVGIGRSAEIRGVYYLSTAGGVGASMSMGVAGVVETLERELGIKVWLAGGRYNTANLNGTHTEAEIWTDTVWLGSLMADAGLDGINVRTVASAVIAIDEDSALFGAGLGGIGHLSAGVDEVAPSMGDLWVPYVQYSAAEKVISANLGATITNCLA